MHRKRQGESIQGVKPKRRNRRYVPASAKLDKNLNAPRNALELTAALNDSRTRLFKRMWDLIVDRAENRVEIFLIELEQNIKLRKELAKERESFFSALATKNLLEQGRWAEEDNQRLMEERKEWVEKLNHQSASAIKEVIAVLDNQIAKHADEVVKMSQEAAQLQQQIEPLSSGIQNRQQAADEMLIQAVGLEENNPNRLVIHVSEDHSMNADQAIRILRDLALTPKPRMDAIINQPDLKDMFIKMRKQNNDPSIMMAAHGGMQAEIAKYFALAQTDDPAKVLYFMRVNQQLKSLIGKLAKNDFVENSTDINKLLGVISKHDELLDDLKIKKALIDDLKGLKEACLQSLAKMEKDHAGPINNLNSQNR